MGGTQRARANGKKAIMRANARRMWDNADIPPICNFEGCKRGIDGNRSIWKKGVSNFNSDDAENGQWVGFLTDILYCHYKCQKSFNDKAYLKKKKFSLPKVKST